ncbi:hypothetical protein [Geoalkalibacter sp.]|uniref:hypothetical protein n=1 Tax=Geoalkalibacter sp. TaxID=3041440 RepID=UPI00272E6A9D|nr:hypothetical protein [Geoalkalibacter sp.]
MTEAPIFRRTWPCALLLLSLLWCGPAAAANQPPVADGPALDTACGETLAGLQTQQEELARDIRRLHRELAALREDLTQPGLNEILGGIGYILGLFGVAFFVMGRKNRGPGKD